MKKQAEIAALEERVRWWQRQDCTVRGILDTYVQGNGRLHNEIGRLRRMLQEVARYTPDTITCDIINKIRGLLEDPHIGDNP